MLIIMVFYFCLLFKPTSHRVIRSFPECRSASPQKLLDWSRSGNLRPNQMYEPVYCVDTRVDNISPSWLFSALELLSVTNWHVSWHVSPVKKKKKKLEVVLSLPLAWLASASANAVDTPTVRTRRTDSRYLSSVSPRRDERSGEVFPFVIQQRLNPTY